VYSVFWYLASDITFILKYNRKLRCKTIFILFLCSDFVLVLVFAYLHSPGLAVATARSKRSVAESRTEEPNSRSAGKSAESEIQIHP